MMKKNNLLLTIALLGINAPSAFAGTYTKLSGVSSLYATTNISDSYSRPPGQAGYSPSKTDPQEGYYTQQTTFRFEYHPDPNNPNDTAPESDATQIYGFNTGTLSATGSISTMRGQVFVHLLPHPTTFEADSSDPNKQNVTLPTTVGYKPGLKGTLSTQFVQNADHPNGAYVPVYTVVAKVNVWAQTSVGGYGGGAGGVASAQSNNAGIRTNAIIIP